VWGAEADSERVMADDPKDSLPPHWREHTWDHRIIQEVVECDEYGLEEMLDGARCGPPGSFHPGDVVMDVGAHVGSFSWACLGRGARRVFAYEVEQENFELLECNLAEHERSVAARNVAVWRSDASGESLFYTRSSDPTNTGAVRVNSTTGRPARHVVRFDDAIEEAAKASDNGRVRLAKLDVEGSEFPILYTATRLELIDELVGEYHAETGAIGGVLGLPPFSMPELSRHLQEQGLTVSWSDRSGCEPGLGIFRARR
jgi:FkbM family methyltransferase